MLPTELSNIHDVEFSPDGKQLVASGGQPAAEGIVELYAWPSRELIRRASPHDDVIYAIAWRPDGQELSLASGDRQISLMSVAATAHVRYLEGHSRAVLAVAYLHGDVELLTGGIDQSIRCWDVPAGTTRRTLTNHTRAVHDLKVRPTTDSQSLPLVASAGADRTVRFWQPTIGRLVRFARLESEPLAIVWSLDGRRLWAACRDGHVRAIDPESATVTNDLPAIEGVAYALCAAPDGSILVGGNDGQFLRINH
jgi:WD40 repeat protein